MLEFEILSSTYINSANNSFVKTDFGFIFLFLKIDFPFVAMDISEYTLRFDVDIHNIVQFAFRNVLLHVVLCYYDLVSNNEKLCNYLDISNTNISSLGYIFQFAF